MGSILLLTKLVFFIIAFLFILKLIGLSCKLSQKWLVMCVEWNISAHSLTLSEIFLMY